MKNSEIDRRLVGNYDKQDKQFYFLIQKWKIFPVLRNIHDTLLGDII